MSFTTGARRIMVMGLAAAAIGAAAARAATDPLVAAIGSPVRTPKFVARDVYRHPLETLRFFGLRPDQSVVEIWPGGGWYMEILAPYLQEKGRYYAAIAAPEGAHASK
ncbi:MAG: methyltransferase, partial [Gammaproteobacteria bacterium]|nr:methyltransferase [Gammaproteobacteria bacterium]